MELNYIRGKIEKHVERYIVSGLGCSMAYHYKSVEIITTKKIDKLDKPLSYLKGANRIIHN